MCYVRDSDFGKSFENGTLEAGFEPTCPGGQSLSKRPQSSTLPFQHAVNLLVLITYKFRYFSHAVSDVEM